jgi:hypothetical protein
MLLALIEIYIYMYIYKLLVFGLINLIKINEIVRYLVKIIVVFRKNKNKNLLYKTIKIRVT